MQNKPNFKDDQMNVNIYYIKDYQIFIPLAGYKNKPKTNPILSAVGGLQMNVNPYITTAYENKHNWTLGQNKPNSNPNKPNLVRRRRIP